MIFFSLLYTKALFLIFLYSKYYLYRIVNSLHVNQLNFADIKDFAMLTYFKGCHIKWLLLYTISKPSNVSLKHLEGTPC